jgi:hypothetical protein
MWLKLNKKAVSLIISYVLLISIGLSIAGLVYGWLRFYVDIGEGVKCPDGVYLAIMSAPYSDGDLETGESLSLNLTLENRGRYNIEGYVIKISNNSNAKLGTFFIYDLRDGLGLGQDTTTFLPPLYPGNISTHQFNTTHLQQHKNVCFIEVQPYIKENNQRIPCSQISTRKINCHPSA